jgi:uncharacterized membrane protein YedE/YeeE
MASFTPVSALIGGALIGLAASLMLLFEGRILGISGIVSGLLERFDTRNRWRVAFLVGLVGGGMLMRVVAPELVSVNLDRPTRVVAVSGLLVGFGTVMGYGCTSGHGVCGMSRLSPRSIVGTVTFMAGGFLCVGLTRLLLGSV